MYTKDLSGNVTLYGQESEKFCGAASAEMTRNGYPNPADRLYFKQADLWKTIHFYNSTNATDVSQDWSTDPHGMTGCLGSLTNPAGVQWNEFSDPKRDSVLFDILFWMNAREYPSPVLTSAGWHWVVIVGWTTDVEPVQGSTPTLQWIHVCDPKPKNVGSYRSYTGSLWYAGPWCYAVNIKGTWLNQYVAVVEPPKARGKVRVREMERTGVKILSSDEVADRVKRAINEEQLSDNPRYALLSREDAVTAAPLLVREETTGSKARKAPYYYVVGFGLRGETDGRGERPIRVAAVANAYTGALEELTAFGKPVTYLTETQAKAVVAHAMRVEPEALGDAEASLMFQDGGITHMRSYPFWRVQVRKKNVYVDQAGELYTSLPRGTPGD